MPDWIQTFSGRKFWPLAPEPEHVFIEDVAHALALTCRFTGHCRWFYSVAQHSVLVVGLVREWLLENPGERPVDKRIILSALLHDAGEAYLTDVARPVKKDLVGFKEAENLVMKAVADRFDLPWPMPPMIAWADNVMLATERHFLLAPGPEWNLIEKPRLRMTIVPWTWERAEAEFLRTYRNLIGDADV